MNLDSWKFDTNAQNEALINELKGTLFEYLVAESLSRLAGSECICKTAPDLRNRLLHYESWLRDHDLELIKFLPSAALPIAESIKARIPEQLLGVEVIGKIAGGSGQKELHESDLVLHVVRSDGAKEDFFIGLKFCKTNSYVNTKSGGAQTFLSRYFSQFPKVSQLQDEFNFEMERAYLMMGQTLYEETGLAAQRYEFVGNFGDEWSESGMSHLPGQLSPKLNHVVLEYYQRCILSLYEKITVLYKSSPQMFVQSLYPLMGFGARNLIQVIVFVDYKCEVDQKHYGLNSFKIHTEQNVHEELREMSLGTSPLEISSFEILMRSWRLQIRMKPMNKFTVPGLKVNCSVKYPKNH